MTIRAVDHKMRNAGRHAWLGSRAGERARQQHSILRMHPANQGLDARQSIRLKHTLPHCHKQDGQAYCVFKTTVALAVQ